jgi:hypothetical protein
MTIIKSTLPYNSLLNQADKKYDYVDSYQGSIVNNVIKLNSTDISKAFFLSEPKWVGRLMEYRNKMVAVFGLKTSGGMADRQETLDNLPCEKGGQVGIFKIYDKTENEIVLGQDDKHLNFRVSLYLDESKTAWAETKLTISTSVIFNNLFGRLYFLPVRLFHSLIVKSMLKATIRMLEK